MIFLKRGLLVVAFLLDFHVLANDSEKLVSDAVNSIADYFSIDCVHFLVDFSNTVEISNQNLAKIFSLNFGKSFSFSNVSAYHKLQKRTEKEQCQEPLRVMFQSSETTHAKNIKKFNWIYTSFSDEISSGVWMIFTKAFQDDFVEKFFQDIFLPIDMEIIIAWVHNEMVHFKEVYQVAPSHAIKQLYLGNYSIKTGLLSETRFYISRSNLEGLQLKVAYIEENVPFTTKTRDGYLGGYFGEIWTVLEDLLNISSIYIKVNYNMEQSEKKNSWLKVIQMLKEKSVDVGIGDFIPSNKRVDYLDFSYPLLVSNFQVYYSTPSSGRHFHGYLIPFGSDTWLAIIFWTVINSFCISCFSLIHRRFMQKSRKVLGLSTSFFMTFGGLCGQGASLLPRYLSCRMLFLCTYIVATVVIPSYSASLTRHLTTKPVEFTINDLNDFYRKGSHKIIVVDGSYEYYFFKLTTSDKLIKIKEKYGAEIHPKSYREALLLTCNRKNIGVFAITSALNWELNKAENAHVKEECGLRKMTQDAGMIIYSIIYPKKSRYRKLIDYQLKSLQKTGIIGRLQQKYWMNRINLQKKRWKSVSLENSVAVFWIIFSGTISSLLLLILEQVLMSQSSRRAKEKRRHIRVFSDDY